MYKLRMPLQQSVNANKVCISFGVNMSNMMKLKPLIYMWKEEKYAANAVYSLIAGKCGANTSTYDTPG